MNNIEGWPWKLAIVAALAVAGVMARRFIARENGKGLIETLDSGTIALALVFFVIQPFILQSFWIPTGSMENTLRVQDRLLVSRAIYRLQEPRFQDVIVFEAPTAAQQEPDTDFIKRCVGTAGDTIEVRKGVLFRNGKAVPEIYQLWNSSALPYDMKIVGGAVYSRDYFAPNVPAPWQKNSVTVSEAQQTTLDAAPSGQVPTGQLLMLGDHRSHSLDGHLWGFVPRQNVIGKAVCVFWPPTRLGLVDGLSFHPRP